LEHPALPETHPQGGLRETLRLPPGGSLSDLFCTRCHNQNADAVAHLPKYLYHPVTNLFNRVLPQQQGYLPTFDDDGQQSPTGAITCLTCHEPHGGNNSNYSTMGMFLRPAANLNLCSDCHGSESLWRFLYYHKNSRNLQGGQ